MSKILYRCFILLLLVGIMIGSLPGSTPAAQAAPVGPLGSTTLQINGWPTSGEIIDLVWFYKPPENGDLDTLAQYFNTYILTHADESARDELKAKGVATPFLQYLRFDGIQDPGSCTANPWRNQVAYKAGDFCDIESNHPDWFLEDTSGSRINDGDNFYLMDPGSSGWRSWWLARAKEMQANFGWQGVFLDNVEASLGRFEKMGRTLDKYPSDSSFQNAIAGFLDYIYNDYFKPQNRPLGANIIWIDDPAVWFRYLEDLDGAMDEGWGVDWHTSYKSVSEWEENLSRAEQTQALGKTALLISQADLQTDWNRQKFAFASFLLVSNGRASFRYADYDLYEDIWMYDNYKINIGTPLGPRYQSGNAWKRDFTGGTVSVDPAAHTASIEVSDNPPPPDPTPTPPPPVPADWNEYYLPLVVNGD